MAVLQQVKIGATDRYDSTADLDIVEKTEKFFPNGRKSIIYLQHTRIKRPSIIKLADHVACMSRPRMQSTEEMMW
jgi:hypothetical protein